MKLYLIFMFTIGCCQILNAANLDTKIVNGFKTFKSKRNGYEITYPECLKVEPSDAEELELDPEDVESISIVETSGCKNRVFFPASKLKSIALVRYPLNSETPASKIERISKDLKSQASRGIEKYIVVEPKLNTTYSLVSIKEEWDYVKWEFYMVCEKKMFRFHAITHEKVKLTDDYRKKLLNKDFSDIKGELSVIESFKCN